MLYSYIYDEPVQYGNSACGHVHIRALRALSTHGVRRSTAQFQASATA